MPNGNRLSRWRPVFDFIEVNGVAQKIIRFNLDGVEREIILTREQAAHLAGLLTAE